MPKYTPINIAAFQEDQGRAIEDLYNLMSKKIEELENENKSLKERISELEDS